MSLNWFLPTSSKKVNFEKKIKMLVSYNMLVLYAQQLSTQCGILLKKDFGKYLGARMVYK